MNSQAQVASNSHNGTRAQSKQNYRPSIPPSNAFAFTNPAYDEPASVNEQGENLPEI